MKGGKNYMNMKEAIKKVKSLNEILCEETISDIISALKCGKRYKAIVKDIEKDFNDLHCDFFSEHAFNLVKQKHFL